MVAKIWAAFIANLGGKPFKSKIDHITSYRTILLAIFLDGVIIWISYRSFLFSELSATLNKYPFNDLDSLAKSGYKYVKGTLETTILDATYLCTFIDNFFVGYTLVLKIPQYSTIYQVNHTRVL